MKYERKMFMKVFMKIKVCLILVIIHRIQSCLILEIKKLLVKKKIDSRGGKQLVSLFD